MTRYWIVSIVACVLGLGCGVHTFDSRNGTAKGKQPGNPVSLPEGVKETVHGVGSITERVYAVDIEACRRAWDGKRRKCEVNPTGGAQPEAAKSAIPVSHFYYFGDAPHPRLRVRLAADERGYSIALQYNTAVTEPPEGEVLFSEVEEFLGAAIDSLDTGEIRVFVFSGK